MKAIGIITDSHSGITQKEAKQRKIQVLPMPFYVGDECCYEGVSLTRQEFLEKLRLGTEVKTSQPSPAEVLRIWDQALQEYEKVLYIPISSGLSGSYATSLMLAQEEPYAGRVLVVDSGRVSALLHRMVLDAQELIEEGYSAEEIRKVLEDSRDKMVIYIGVQTLENLRRGGRITPAAAALGTILNIKPVLQFDVGTLDVFRKCRGFAKTKKTMLEAMRHDLETRFKEWYDRGEISLLAASSAPPEETEKWVGEIKAAFPELEVMCDDLSMGVSCHIGYGGLGIGCSCRPPRPGKRGL